MSARTRELRRSRQLAIRKRETAQGMVLLRQLRDDQIAHVRHLLRSWTGPHFDGSSSLSEGNPHIGICRRAIRRTLQDRP